VTAAVSAFPTDYLKDEKVILQGIAIRRELCRNQITLPDNKSKCMLI